ncbi:glycoside hydrolase family 88/105 protein [Kibdelosporangium phytohabitans]|uniref:glycoside hydrolase family 88/105 protein n=1 Tax=Kibdelosporangium phytohabitans TaxID=860235 RepID=UPI000A8D98E2|nr:glycoside hydrolase family 88 protein [Kibdelosporangium phytohabitans]MBE1462852.1 unsaturated rhamnogalacturonyl hydrolase [Kibdelosporangium phytohabitans]
MPTRRSVLLGGAGAALGLPALPSTAGAIVPDWSVELVDSTMARFTPATLGGWDYTRGLYLYGQYLVYKRTGNRAYFDYVKAWVDRFVDGNGNISNGFNDLDAMRPGVLLPILHAETGRQRYKTAADKIRNRFNTYPRTSDGGMWHATGKTGELWADGVYMAQPFIANYARQYNQTYGFDESTRNMVTYFNRLKSGNGLLFHACDADGSQWWAPDPARHSAHVWARAVGWFGMSAIDILEVLPANHVRRQALIDTVRHLAGGFRQYQDQASGRWFQVVDRGTTSGNWTETSASAMFTYTISRAVQRGYLDASFKPVADRGYQGVLQRISLGADGRTNLREIVVGTGPGDLNYYFDRPRATNDFHGLGAFLIMNEQLALAV